MKANHTHLLTAATRALVAIAAIILGDSVLIFFPSSCGGCDSGQRPDDKPPSEESGATGR